MVGTILFQASCACCSSIAVIFAWERPGHGQYKKIPKTIANRVFLEN
ncbi:hypothetical protein DBT_1681 [Dissulfuribacter thermophilus]|uniref:Uncharacterized protein n=1 Tax=Dissulfuribacter thermophilus TaxID=1156395 RepID=A0A1B9F4M7_9BACT|nr:hypothetical protein DBT_1681 [Dissulfuribacter thermophilus]